jgi:hypothetical protein
MVTDSTGYFPAALSAESITNKQSFMIKQLVMSVHVVWSDVWDDVDNIYYGMDGAVIRILRASIRSDLIV